MNIEELISVVYDKEPLWNRRNKDHHNRYALDELWDEVATEIHSTSSVCRSKWKTLRDIYRREMKKTAIKPSDDEESYKPIWKYYERLTFLQDQFRPRKFSSKGDITIQEDTAEVTENKECVASTNNAESRVLRRKRSNDDNTEKAKQKTFLRDQFSLINSCSKSDIESEEDITEIADNKERVTSTSKAQSRNLRRKRSNDDDTATVHIGSEKAKEKIFLRDQFELQNSCSKSDIEIEEDVAENAESKESSSSTSSTESRNLKRKQNIDDDATGIALIRSEKAKQKKLQNQQMDLHDESDMKFYESLLPYTRQLSLQKRLLLRTKIQNLVYKFVFGNNEDLAAIQKFSQNSSSSPLYISDESD